MYERYFAYYDFDENSVKRGDALSRIRFTKFITKNYKDYVYDSTQRVRGSAPAKAFVGMRLKTLDEIVADAEAREREKNASRQAPAPAPQAQAAPVVVPIDDENPFN